MINLEKLKHNFDEYNERRGSDSKKYGSGDYKEDVLPMWIADTDFRVPEPVAKAAVERASHELYGYPYNLSEFNIVVKNWMKKRHNWDIKEDDVEFVHGVVHGALYTLEAFTHPGDKVVCLTPLFGPLKEIVVDNGRQIVSSSMIEEDGYYTINFDDLEKKMKDPRVSMFILCNPHNPVGKVYTKEELERIGDICIRNNVVVFNDEVHADIIYKGNHHISFPSIKKEFADITVTGMNPGKTFNVAGARTAAVIIQNKHMMDKFLIARKNAKALGRTVFGQAIFIACYRDCEYYVDQLVEYLEANVDYVKDYIKNNIPEISFRKPEGMFLLWLDCRKLRLNQNELVKLFTDVGKIAMNSGTSFGEEGTGFMRLNIAVPRSVVEEGMSRIKKAIDSLS